MLQPQIVYEHTHRVAVTRSGVATPSKDVNIRISKSIGNQVLVKVYETDNYSFNYSCCIDHTYFNQIKLEQALEISFEELQTQIVDLLHEVQREQMSIRLDTNSSQCKMVFYEKARLKSLIFLTIDLEMTNHAEIINEMSMNMAKMKDINKNLSTQLMAARSALQDKDCTLTAAIATHGRFERQVKKDMHTLENVFTTTITALERQISDQLVKLNRRHLKLIGDVDTVRRENSLKGESSARLANSLQCLRVENERSSKTIDDLRMEVNHLKILRTNAEESSSHTRTNLAKRDRDIDELRKQNDEQKKDLQDAALIIAQKTKTHDELAKDLVQANTMLVNFSNRCETLSKELAEAGEAAERREKLAKDEDSRAAKLAQEFERYKAQFNAEELNKVKQELFFTKQNLHELEKQNKEAIKLNGLLTRKLSDTTVNANVRNVNMLPPSQRNNY